jgi:hypothetical protein
MTGELDIARRKFVDEVVSGKTRKIGAPVEGIREPEPSEHPDERMNLTIKDVGRWEPESSGRAKNNQGNDGDAGRR